MVYGVFSLLLGILALYKVIKYPTKEEDEVLYNDIRLWTGALVGICAGIYIIISELIRSYW